MQTLEQQFMGRFKWRSSLLLGMAGLLIAVIVLRSLWLVTSAHVSELAMTSRLPLEHTRTVQTQAKRGGLYDRRGLLLSSDQARYRIYADSTIICSLRAGVPLSLIEVGLDIDCQKKPSGLMRSAHLSMKEASERIEHWNQVAQSKQLKRAVWKVADGFARVYPQGPSAGTVTGFIGYNGHPSAGAEQVYGKGMSGNQGILRVRYSLKKRIIELLKDESLHSDGQDQHLSLDMRLQEYGYQLAMETKQRLNSKHVSILLADVRSGEILAMSQAPGFDAQSRDRYSKGEEKNLALSAVYEPGSVMKPFFIATALEEGVWQPDSIVKPDAMARDSDWKSYQLKGVPFKSALVHSHSGAIRSIAASLDARKVLSLIKKVGFGSATDVFEADRSSRFEHAGKVSAMDLNNVTAMQWYQDYLNLSTGYAIQATPMQLLNAYTIFATDGFYQPLSLRKGDHSANRERVISDATAKSVRSLLNRAVAKGTGVKAQVAEYAVAGKTGTARKLAASGDYREDLHALSFVGFAPAHDPAMIALVWIEQPGIAGSASKHAAPVFSKMMQMALHLYQIPTTRSELTQQLAMRTETLR